MQKISFTIKVLEKHAKVLKSLLSTTDCDSVYTGTTNEPCGTETHVWFISRSVTEVEIGVEKSLEDLSIPYDRICHGLMFKPLSHRQLRIDSEGKARLLQFAHGDNTLALLDELETEIAGNDYTFVRNFILKKRNQYLCHLGWDTQKNYSIELEVV